MPKKRRVTAPEPRKKARAGRDPKAVRGKEDSGTRARLNVPGAAAPFEIVADETELQDAAM